MILFSTLVYPIIYDIQTRLTWTFGYVYNHVDGWENSIFHLYSFISENIASYMNCWGQFCKGHL